MWYFHTYIEVTMSRRGTRLKRFIEPTGCRAQRLLFGTHLALYRIACQFGNGV